MPGSSFRAPLTVAAGAILALIGIDLGLRAVSPLPPPLLEVAEGMDAYERGDPDMLAIGSSHTRSLAPIRDELKSAGQGQLTLIPVEAGSFGCYDWVLQNRIRPLIEEGTRKNLRRFIIVTTYYDLCTKPVESSLPGRAWTLRHFLADVARVGINDFNRNYVQRKFNRIFPYSVQVQGHEHILDDLQRRFRSPEALAWKQREFVKWWQGNIEDQYAICDDSYQRAALTEMLDYLTSKHIEVVMAMFPIMPLTLTEKAKSTTVKRYAEFLAELARKYPLKIVDMTYDSPLVDDDYMTDMDHVTLPGNRKFATWALEHDLSFLRSRPAAQP